MDNKDNTAEAKSAEEEGWEKYWEEDNNRMPDGVNPHAHRLGFMAAQKLTSQAVEKLKIENERLRQAYDYIHATRNSVDKEINDLRGEIKQREQSAVERYKDEVSKELKLRADVIKELEHLKHLIGSKSVYTLLRFGDKNPTMSGVDDCEDDNYIDLYNISRELLDTTGTNEKKQNQ